MNIQDRITKFTDLENDDSLSAYNGHTAQQSHNVYQIFYDFIQNTKPKQILEIGTALGGFTEFLFLICKELNLDTKIISYDIDRRPWYSEMVDKGIDVTLSALFLDIQARDERDSTRSISPLKPAEDAVTLDTTSLSIDQVVEQVLLLVKERFGTELRKTGILVK